MPKYLCVAEKPSISKSITQILSGGQFNTRNARHPAWIKNYDFSYRQPPGPGFSDFTVTAVAGHLTESDFAPELKSWKSCDPFALFDAPIYRKTSSDPAQKGIEANLIAEAKKATHLMIWTDCDREGEHIGSEVAEICRKANPRIIVKRARFSAIIAAQINHACRNPVDLDMRQAAAVEARMILDLRVGAALTRTQTLSLQPRFQALADKIISYGPCQFPTLGFVVDQYERVESFIPEQFWYIHVTLERDDMNVAFSWRRGRLFDQQVVETLFGLCEDEPEATVVRQQTKPTQKWKPLPLTTVELQKTGSRLLHMAPKTILDISDALYQKGYLSYPRTETDQFDKDFNFHEMIEKHVGDNAWGGFAQNLMNGAFERPRNGKKNDKAHPPIHPTAHVNNLTGDDKKVYDLVVRSFLACCSSNAKGMETTVEIDIAGELFSATGLSITERNYLDVYIYDKWNGNMLPRFQEGERFEPTTCEIKEGTTTRPNLLTEADLVSLMDKNGIGTDATIAEHISKIIEREYVMKQPAGNVVYLLPSTLGIGLVEGYNAVGFEKSLSKPHLRRLTEHRMTQVCEGAKTKQDIIDETLDEYREVYIKAKREFNTFLAASVFLLLVGGGRIQARAAQRGEEDEYDAFFDDDDDLQQDAPPAAIPSCQCGDDAAERTVAKEGPNKGRKFFTCAKGKDNGCGFFAWTDEPGRGGGGGGAGGGRQQVPQKRAYQGNVQAATEDAEERRCDCELTAAQRTVTKEGPNTGRKFWVCPNVSKKAQCNYL
ncbi:DNA topoisomerase III [Pseudohyphozyma bogoriensis]|nr:DNA topoisomerase III [Pseudohyphozyma bogoriensis]